jgi:hypothetical protein
MVDGSSVCMWTHGTGVLDIIDTTCRPEGMEWAHCASAISLTRRAARRDPGTSISCYYAYG